MVCHSIEKSGFSFVTEIGKSGDQGGDITGYKDGKNWVFQCKRYSNNVGNKAVQQAHFAKTFYQCDTAAVITNQFFTEAARTAAKASGVELWNRLSIVNLLKEINSSSARDNWSYLPQEKYWPKNIYTDQVYMPYYNALPYVFKETHMRDYIKCYPIGGQRGKYNPYLENNNKRLGFVLVEIYSENFQRKEEAEHFLKAIEKRYFVKPINGVQTNESNTYYYVSGIVIGELIKKKFDEKGCFWNLENYSA